MIPGGLFTKQLHPQGVQLLNQTPTGALAAAPFPKTGSKRVPGLVTGVNRSRRMNYWTSIL